MIQIRKETLDDALLGVRDRTPRQSADDPGVPDGQHTSRVEHVSLFDMLALYTLALAVAVLPIAFIPSLSFPYLFTKSALAACFVLTATVLYAVARFQSREITLPRQWFLLSLVSIPAAAILSLLVTGVAHGFLGERLGLGTPGFLLIGTLAALLSALLITTRDRMLVMLMAFVAGFSFVALFFLVRLFFGAEALSFGVFDTLATGPFGLLTETGMFMGLMAILSLLTLTSVRLPRLPTVLVLVVLVVSLFLVVVTNVRLVWWALGATALAALLYSWFSTQIRSSKHEHQPESNLQGMIGSLSVLVLSLLFLFGSQGLSSAVATWFDVGQLDVRPSWRSTLDIGQAVFADELWFGNGPGTFSAAWAEHRPLVTNQTIAWNTDFTNGIGLLPTLIISTGLFGLVSWLVCLGWFIYLGVRHLLLRGIGEPFDYFLSLSTFIGALYLWVLAVMAVPNAVLFLFAFILTGLFVASLRFLSHGHSVLHVSFVERPRVGFVSALSLTVVILASVVTTFVLGERYTAAVFYQKALLAADDPSTQDQSQAYLARAATFSEQDRIYRLSSALYLVSLERLLAENQEPDQAAIERFRLLLGRAIETANAATARNPENYLNWLQLASVYRAIVPVGIEGAPESSLQAYERALALRPASPSVLFSMAQVEIARGGDEAATTLLTEAIAQRPVYTDAIFALAQVQVRQGDIDAAIASVEAATMLTPNNPLAYFQLGILQYSQENYEEAVRALQSAVSVNNEYANARYFLGLSYYWLERVDEAIAEFRMIETLNPDNQEVKSIIQNMENGLHPLTGGDLDDEVAGGSTDITELSGLPLPEDGADELFGEAASADEYLLSE